MAGLALAAASPAGAEGRGPLAVFPFKLLDTSGEPNDQTADHDRRLRAMGEALARELRGPQAFSAASLVAAEEIAQACPTETPACLLGVGRRRGEAFVLFGVLHKSSSLIMQLFLTVVALEGREVVVSREFNFRGDTDEAWTRAKDFLVGQIGRDLAAREKPPVAPAPRP